MRFLVLGGGRQGSACAFDLVRRDRVEKVILADADVSSPKEFLRPFVGRGLELRDVDARVADQVCSAMAGVLDYYTTPVLVLEHGEVVEKEALTETETVTFGALGELEAFLTDGGVSRMPYQYQGRVASMAYKTLRWRAHVVGVRAGRRVRSGSARARSDDRAGGKLAKPNPCVVTAY